MAKLGVSEHRNLWTDCHKIWQGWLCRRRDSASQDSNWSTQWGRPGKLVKYHLAVYSHGPWITEMRYVGVCFFTNSRTLKCSLDAAKRGFYRAADNSIFGKVGRTASDEVVPHLVKYKCRLCLFCCMALRCWIWTNLSRTPSILWQTDLWRNVLTLTICKL